MPFDQAAVRVYNALETGGKPGLAIDYKGVSGSVTASVSVQTYVDPSPKAAPDTSYFEVYASPALYSSQTVTARIECPGDENPDARFFIDYYDANDEVAVMREPARHRLVKGENTISWKIPDTHGRAVYRLGVELVSDSRRDGTVILRSVDWRGAPERFHMGLANDLTPGISPFVTRTKWMMAFMNSTKHTGPDFLATFAISHPERNGVMTIGANDWEDYAVESTVQFVHAEYAGLVARAKGHRNYYAGVFGGGQIKIIKRQGPDVTVLAVSDKTYREGDWHDLRLEVKGDRLTFLVDGEEAVVAQDNTFASGSTGYVVDEGAIVAKYFTVSAI